MPVNKFRFSISTRLFAVAGEKIGESGNHVPRQMLHDGCDAVLMWIEPRMQSVVVDLCNCPFRQPLGFAEFILENRDRRAAIHLQLPNQYLVTVPNA